MPKQMPHSTRDGQTREAHPTLCLFDPGEREWSSLTIASAGARLARLLRTLVDTGRLLGYAALNLPKKFLTGIPERLA